nr:histidinol-phosphate transaminase [uncultured Cohaesibacter sp.]
MSKFWSPIVGDLQPYIPGEQPKGQRVIKLNTNESPYGPSDKVLEAIRVETGEGLRLYPDPTASALRTAIGESHGLDASHVFAGNGSDEVLAHAFRAFFSGKQPILFADITYSFYKTYCRLFEIEHQLVPLDETFRYRLEDYACPSGGIVVANPNAPTGIAQPLAAIEQILQQNPDVVVLVDEAYVDFGAESAARLIPHYDNLLVVQTFSKSRALAGMRVGFALGQRHLIDGLIRVKDSFNSYPLGRLALASALAAWQDREGFEETITKVKTDRAQLTDDLIALGFDVLPSAANFVFASHKERPAATILAALRERGILVRHFNHPRIDNWLRISIGTNSECQMLVNALKEILTDPG